ncbi:hypothetical protein LXA43DRAFT_882467 [Ganoderma leucocontextum]|nr:hypothetical protein LXA43DRAFT_890637 [Ganoderma leucocontextum]KAI1795236.1 hypothetical protein LXA43DRAFT_882467 [Ganoderma leucocontextum]
MSEIRKRHEHLATDCDAPQPSPDASDCQSEDESAPHPIDDSDDLGHHLSPSAGNLHLHESHPRRVLPDAAAYRLYSNWLVLIPTLVDDYLGYMQRSQGRLGRPLDLLTSTFQSCNCSTIPQILVHNGLFPTSPVQPRLAVSIDLLDFYSALFDRSADAVTALAGALKTMYSRRGFHILNEKGEPVHDPFRRGLGQAIQWYDSLRRSPESMLEKAVDACIPLIKGELKSDRLRNHSDEHLYHDPRVGEHRDESVTTEFCNRFLQKLCPACFGGTRFGRSFEKEGGDIHVAIDATFSQRHNVAAGESPWFYEPKYFIPKQDIDRMDARITAARKKPPRLHHCEVPDTAIDECEKSYEAADEKKEKTHGAKFDDTGLMALVCRHDIVLFLANVDTPGEQQKFGIALIERLFSHLPPEATVTVFYDIGCVMDRSLHQYDILSDSIIKRLLFATSAMHAYGHQWACQLVYNPRLREGLGLTEGEGTERIWSKMRKLIGVTRTSGRSRRIWMLDRHTDVINATARENLGGWIRGRLKNGVRARDLAADQDMARSEMSLRELREQWAEQRTAQLSVRNRTSDLDAPAKLKRELDAVLTLQTELNQIDEFIQQVQKAITKDASNPEAHNFLNQLRSGHQDTIGKVEGLYASLNVADTFPEIQGLPLDFIRTLLLARDLKINIRKRATGSFFEWDKLDRAAGGLFLSWHVTDVGMVSGTKLHQQTRKAIAKRTPALLTAIRKFNNYCDLLAEQYQPAWEFPLPTRLPTTLNELREDSSLLADVWVTRVSPTIPRWLKDVEVRQGIRAMLMKDRCLEERRRLGSEADNMWRWYGLELAAVELAIRDPKNTDILFLLQQEKEKLLLLQFQWRTTLVSDLRLKSQVSEATRLARKLSGAAEPLPLHWVHVSFQDECDDDPSWDATSAEQLDEETCLVHDALEFIYHRDDTENRDTERAFAGSTPPAMPLIPRSPPESCTVPATVGHSRLVFDRATLDRLHQRDAWLNDECIDLGSQVLLRHLGTTATRGIPALFSCYTLSSHRKSDDASLWRVCRPVAQFGGNNIWVIPIHRPEQYHWTLAIIYWRKRRIAYFDSLGSKNAFESDAKDIFILLHRLHRLATAHGETPSTLDGSWKAYPLVTEPLQRNSWDCGVWVLACIAGILRGYTSVALTAEGIAEFRQRLVALIYTMSGLERSSVAITT